jgi:hypothetical protein
MAQPMPLSTELSPDSIDALTELTQILTRLRATAAAAAAGVSLTSLNVPGSTTAGLGLGGVNSITSASVSIVGVTGTTPLPTTSANTTAAGASENPDAPLTIKEIPTATDNLKHKLQKARARIRNLPDMQRSTEQQEEEIRQLEGRIARQQEVLGRLREMGAGFKKQYSGQGAGDSILQ